MKITSNDSGLIIESENRIYAISKENISFRITNPEMIVIYKTDDLKIFLEEAMENIIIDDQQVTPSTAIAIL